MASHLLDALIAIGIRDQLSSNSRVLVLAFAAIQVPGVPDHELKVVVLVDRRAHILVVVLEFGQRHLVVTDVSIPLGHELRQDIITAHLACLELGVLGHVVSRRNVIQIDQSTMVSVQLVICELDESQSSLVHVAADAPEELVVRDFAVVVFVEVLKNALEFGGAECVAVLAEAPHELIAVHLFVTVVVHAAEDNSQTTDSVCATGFHSVQDLLKNLIRRFTLDSEDRVDVRVVATALDSEPSSKFLIVQLVVAIFVILIEHCPLFKLREGAANALQSSGEL